MQSPYNFALVAIFTTLLPLSLAQLPTCTLSVPNLATVAILAPPADAIDADTKESTASSFTYHDTINSAAVSVRQKWMVLLTCHPAFTLIGASRLICTPSSTAQSGAPRWSGKIPECRRNACLMLSPQDKTEFRYYGQRIASNLGGYPVDTEMTGHQNINYCPPGSKIEPSSEKSICLENGFWSTPTPRCVVEADSCSWTAGTGKDVKFRLQNRILEKYSRSHLPVGSEIIDYGVVTCPPGFMFKGSSVKVCHKGNWILAEQPCVPSWNVSTSAGNADTYTSEGEHQKAECHAASSHCGLVIWGISMTLLCVALIVYIVKPCDGALRIFSRKYRSKRPRSSECSNSNEITSESRRQRVSIVHLPNSTHPEGAYSTIPDGICQESIYSDVSPCSSSMYGGLKSESITTLETAMQKPSAEELPSYSIAVPKSKR